MGIRICCKRLFSTCAIVVCVVCLWLSSLSAVHAHNMPVSIARIHFFDDGHFEIELLFDVDSSIANVYTEDRTLILLFVAYAQSRLSDTVDDSQLEILAHLICKDVRMEFSGQIIQAELLALDLGVADDPMRQQRALFRGQAPLGHTRCRWYAHPMLPNVNVHMSRKRSVGVNGHVNLGSDVDSNGDSDLDAEYGGTYIEVVPINQSSAEWTGVPSSNLDVAAVYWQQGIVHIIPLGLDHILFIIGLFLVCKTRSSVLWQVSAFTVAHSISLGLCASGMVLPAWLASWVEVIIALSIITVAVEACFYSEMPSWRPYLVFLFGLIHGMGFAGVLLDVGLPDDFFWVALLSFNIGIEMAQLLILAVLAAALYKWMKKDWYRQRVHIPIAVCIACSGLYMLIDRL